MFAESIAVQDWLTARVVALWMFSFLAGACISGISVSHIGRNQRFLYVIPILIEIVILLTVALMGHQYNGSLVSKEIFAGSLLFSMGLQNSLVSLVSGFVIRTTHLTGNVHRSWDRNGAVFHHKKEARAVLKLRIKLRVAIIFFFMCEALAGAWLFRYFSFHALFMHLIILFYTLLYDVSG